MREINRFRYYATTLGLSGHITLPFQEYIPAQASVQLPESGGYAHSRVDHFNFRDLVRFDRAIAFAAGSWSQKDDAYDATATVTIAGLNFLNVVTADCITARIASSHPKSGANPVFSPIGCCFENLRIGGVKVDVDLAIDTFSELATIDHFNDVRQDPAFQSHVLDDSAASTTGVTYCTMVREIAGLGREVSVKGNTIVIPHFGTIRLGQFMVAPRRRSVTMLQFEIGSTPTGSGQVGSAEGNGDGN